MKQMIWIAVVACLAIGGFMFWRSYSSDKGWIEPASYTSPGHQRSPAGGTSTELTYPPSYGGFEFIARPYLPDPKDQAGWSDEIDTQGPRKGHVYVYPERIGKYTFSYKRLDPPNAPVQTAYDKDYVNLENLPVKNNRRGDIQQFRSMSEQPVRMYGVWRLTSLVGQEPEK